ncbi:alanine dehydrogenase [Chitinilyticum litopenaei]|uniref:alanine dehydrogenase n=1 Tax=Chitinilyticum litopenaei TaxID=1121276 RepID=UPI00041B7DBC|nr:alanine dehydrogenase [Chitinilyticum litopenaei]
MQVGVPKEIKIHEYRVGMVPASVRELTSRGHRVLVETGAGAGIGFGDDAYRAAGADIAANAAEVFATAELIVKVKEPQAGERAMLRAGQLLFTYLHLAPDRPQTEELLASGAIAIAYETVSDKQGGLPLLAPMSEVAGRMAVQAGARALEKSQGGAGILLGGVPGVAPAKVVVLGGGVVGANAARMALGLHADVTVLDRNIDTLRRLDREFGGVVKLIYATQEATERLILQADLVIGAVLLPGAAAPKLIRREHLAQMRPGSVIVDVAIDQGGCAETSRPTTHDNPVYVVDGIVHYCVANMPGAVARTSTFALNNATLPYIVKLADLGWRAALRSDAGFLAGLNVAEGKLTCKAVAEAHGLPFHEAQALL